MQLLQLFLSGNIAWTSTNNYSHHHCSAQQLQTSHTCFILTDCTVNRNDFHYLLTLNTVHLIQDVLSSEKSVYVGDVTINWAAFSSAIIYGCGLCLCV